MRSLAFAFCLLVAAPVLAEEAAPETVAAAAKNDFEKTARLEELRYRHLWIAYGAAWLIVFVFAFRTWKRAEQTDVELEALKKRLAELESKHG